jgi:CheY-like chemotaxis protein
MTFEGYGGSEGRRVREEEYADLSGLRVLVVEDDTDARDMLVDVLVGQGAVVRAAGNGVDAVALVATFRPDVLVSDIGLPDMDGYALIRRVRDLGSAAGGGVPAIALTGYADAEDSRRARAAGYQVHVAKPVEGAILTRAVAEAGRVNRAAG